MRLRTLTALLPALGLLLLSGYADVAVPADTPNAFQNAVWVGQSGGILKVASADGQLLLEIGGAGDARAVAIDAISGKLWVTDGTTIRAFGPAGEPLVSVPLRAAPCGRDTEPVKPTANEGESGKDEADVCGEESDQEHIALAADKQDGSVWVASHKTLYRVDAAGQPTAVATTKQPINALAHDDDGRLIWVAAGNDVLAYDAAGTPQRRLTPGKSPVNALAHDSTGAALWASDEHTLYRYDNDGRLQLKRPFAHLGLLAADHQGNLWGAAKQRLFAIDSTGGIRFELEPLPRQDGRLLALAADPGDHSAWVASRRHVAQVTADAAVRQTLDLDWIEGGPIRSLAVYADTVPPTVTYTAPADGDYLNTASPRVTLVLDDVGSGVDNETLRFREGDSPIAADCTFTGKQADCTVGPFADGPTALTASAQDRAGNLAEPVTITFTVDTVPPAITLSAPSDGAYVNQPAQTLAGQVSEAASLRIGSETVPLDAQLAFHHSVTLIEGSNSFELEATDPAGNIGRLTVTLILDTVAPSAPSLEGITVTIDAGTATIQATPGTAEPGARVVVTNTRTGESVTVTVNADGSFSATLAAEPGDTLAVQAVDVAGNGSETRTVKTGPAPEPVPGTGYVPPDPATVAPPLNPTGITPFHAATEFLYAGPHPIQHGVAPGTIEERRAAVLRGRVTDRSGAPVAGVTVTILNHPELGWSGTRADGAFDLAVNGGGLLTVNYEKTGHLPVQRQIDVPWEDYVWLPDVVMIGLDPQVTTIDLMSGAPIQVAQGSTVTDEDGTRQATLLFAQGTQATLVMPDGSTKPLTSLNVRATEYTVGANGPQAMPGPLPATSGYTYAVELSVDEAIAAGAQEVRFDRPIPIYVDNFLEFPVGGVVPMGWYDRARAAWIPSENGRIVKVLSISNGLANLDVSGSGQAADAAALAALGITDAERAQLADLYAPDKSLWRVPVKHFTPWDCNWPYGPPWDAVVPPSDSPAREDEDNPDDPCERPGCIIEAENQVLGESISIVGTPYTLNYRSNRVRGYVAGRTIEIPVSGASTPASLKRIDLTISVAGQRHRRTFPAAPNLRTTFVWDGKDGDGRPVQGGAKLTYQLQFVYQAVYYPGNASMAFGQTGSGAAIGRDRGASEVYFLRAHTIALASATAIDDVGHWSLDAHHGYNLADSTLHRGDGKHTRAAGLGVVIDTVAGIGNASYGGISGDNGPATKALLNNPTGVALGPDGSLVIADSGNNLVRRVRPNGIITTVAGNVWGYRGVDGGPATRARLYHPTGVAFGPDGSVYIAEAYGHRIRKVGPDGIIATVAGTGAYGYGGDGGPAAEARLSSPYGVVHGPDGSLYIADAGNSRIRRVGPDGIITTVAGTGAYGYSGDGGPATQAQIYMPRGVALGPDGSLYIGEFYNHRIRRVGPDGVISTVAGNGTYGNGGDGGPAVQAQVVYPEGVAFGPDGRLYIAETYSHRIRQVGPDGIIATVAGTGAYGYGGDGGPAAQALFKNPTGVALGPDGSLYIADSNNHGIRRLSTPIRSLATGEFMIPATDNSEYYVFDASGRHMRTFDSVAGIQRHVSTYDASGYLIGLEDGDGNTTFIERDGAGNPIAIIAPDGQRTEVTLDANGYLASVTNPAGESYGMTYTADGLLTQVTKPNDAVYTYTYDAMGRLTSESQPGGSGWTLARTKTAKGFEGRLTSGEGRTSRFGVERLSATEVLRTSTAPDGVVATRYITTADTEISEAATAADGTKRTRHKVPDPRAKMDAPFVDASTVTTPSGVSLALSATRNVTLNNPDDPLTLAVLSESATVNGRTSTTAYTAANRTWTSTSATGRTNVVEVNAKGRPVLSRFADQASAAFAYDPRGRLTQITTGEGADARSVTFGYDPLGNLETVTDALDRTTRFTYDLAGRVTTQTQPDGRVIGYQYDANGNLIALTPPGREAHVFAYTPVDLEEQYTPPDLDGVDTVTRYTYNKDKDLTRIERPDGSAADLTYDAGGRLAALTYPESRLDYAYHPTTGKLAAVMRADGNRLDYTYDGFLPLTETATGEVSGSVSRTYDNNFWVKSLAVNGMPVTFGYDNDGLLTSAGSLTLSRNAQNGLLTGTALGPVQTSRTYNAFGELASETVTVNGGAVLTTVYTRDKLGRITAKEESSGNTTVTTGYAYDLAGRLEKVLTDGVLTATYGYDTNGNRLSKVTPGGSQAGVYDGQDRLTSYAGASYEYTANGDLVAKTENGAATRYQYDALGNLLKVELPGDVVVEYLIDGRNRRIGKKVNGVLVQGFLYQDQLNPVAELDGSGNVVARFVYGSKANGPGYLEKGGKTYRIVSDHLGSPRLVIDTVSREVVQRMDYDEFGNVLEDTNPGFQPFGFAGGVYDLHTGLVRFGARDYDAQAGRWTAKDPIGFHGKIANLYGYSFADPLNFVDKNGMAPGDTHSGPGGSYNTPAEAITALGDTARNLPAQYVEYGGYAYPNYDGTYSPSDLIEGHPDHIPGEFMDNIYNSCPTPPVAEFHTHPDPVLGYTDGPSKQDHEAARWAEENRGIVESWVLTRGNKYVRY